MSNPFLMPSSPKEKSKEDTITILIVEDHVLVRQNLAFLFNRDNRFSVIAECGSADQAIELASCLRPHIVLMDINLAGTSGIEATSLILKVASSTKIIGVSLHSQPAYARKIMQNGASGYVTKNSDLKELLQAVVEVHGGSKYIGKEVKDILSEQMLTEDSTPSGIHSLSQREIEVISQIKKGSTSKEVAGALNISVKTAEVHRYNILRKLNLRNAAALVNFIHNSQLSFL